MVAHEPQQRDTPVGPSDVTTPPSPSSPYPRRFRATEGLNRRLGRPLRLLLGRQGKVDPALLAAIGERLTTRDELGAALAGALRITDTAHPDRVTMRQFRTALADGIDALANPPAALREFFAAVEPVPDWVDFDLVDEGGRVARRFGRNAADVMLQLALIGSYRFDGPPRLLVETGGLTGGSALRRVAETQHWATAVTGHDAMRRSGPGFRLTVHVRLMHALVNHQAEHSGQWDTERWGLPVNQSDLAATLGLFNAVQLLGVRLLGVRVTRAESRALMHLWKYVGHLLGVDEDWLCDHERLQHRLNYHLLLTQSYGGPVGPALANALVEAQTALHFARFARVRRAYARARLLSMLRYFLGRRGVRDLDLPVALPWAVPPLLAVNLLRYHVLGRTAAGRAYLLRSGDRFIRRNLRRYFGEHAPDVGALGVGPSAGPSR
ncbi:oxygenase MpaB family protein [Streptomyces sp. NPDC048251]|uniref:oxygenase MpaB family protein n=1 Tax=Streptomyces sp. NPDC048251 TaxID=3154501 RepID=UPI003415B77D